MTAGISTRLLVVLWIGAGVTLFAALGTPGITRSQEARVLETARQMLGKGWRAWLAPTLNGEPRLQKPPLSYWMSAGAFKLAGVSATVGRIPTALLGWFTLAVVFLLARDLFDVWTALFSSAALLGSVFFFRFTRFAETDPAVACFLTVAVWCIWRASRSRPMLWLHAAALAAALVVLTKGAPAIFVAVFLVSFCAVERRWDLLRALVVCGAPITFLAVALPWFFYIDHTVLLEELRNTTRGGDHFRWPWAYVTGLFIVTAPWSGFIPLALLDALRRWPEPSMRFVLLWFGSILVPLCINGNKQNHYLVMLMPAVMVLVGTLLSTWPAHRDRWLRGIALATVLAGAAGAVASVFMSRHMRGYLIVTDWLTSGLLAMLVILVGCSIRSRGVRRSMPALCAAVAILMPMVLGIWWPSLETRTTRAAARKIKSEINADQFIFFGPRVDLPLCFELQSAIPSALDAERLVEMCKPRTAVIALTKDNTAPLPLPPQFVHRLRQTLPEQMIDVYEPAPAPP